LKTMEDYDGDVDMR